MKTNKFLFGLILVVAALRPSASAQTSGGVKTFDKEGLKFSYPANWTLTDKSSAETQHFFLSNEKNTILAVIVSPRVFIQSQEQFSDLQNNAYSSYVKAISKSFDTTDNAIKQEYLCLDFNGRKVSGTMLTGTFNKEPGRGEIYPFVLGNRFLTLVYMRADKDGAEADFVWRELIKSLYLEDSNKQTAGLFFNSDAIDKGILNGKAIKLAKPSYPSGGRSTGAFGTVKVEVLINEQGKVVSAEAVSGHRLLHSVAEAAAKSSKFSPTLICSEAVKATGTIIYNFVP